MDGYFLTYGPFKPSLFIKSKHPTIKLLKTKTCHAEETTQDANFLIELMQLLATSLCYSMVSAQMMFDLPQDTFNLKIQLICFRDGHLSYCLKRADWSIDDLSSHNYNMQTNLKIKGFQNNYSHHETISYWE